MMQCAIIRDLLPLYVDGLTSEETTREIEAHLATCEACAKALAQLQAPVEQTALDPQAQGWQSAMKKNRSRSRRRLLLAAVAALIIGAAVCLGILYQQEVFAIRARKTAPQGSYTAVMYQDSRDYTASKQEEGFRIRLKQGGNWHREVAFHDAEYLGMYWSPDGRFLAVNYRHGGVSKLNLIDTLGETKNSFSSVLDAAVKYTAAFSWVQWQGDTPLLDCTFVHWSQDSSSILVSAGGTGADGETRQGYFWYHPTGTRLSITGLTDFDGMTREEQAREWSDRVEQFEEWGKNHDLTFGYLAASGYKALAQLLARKAENCVVTYYQYREETEDFAPCDPDTALDRLRNSPSDYAFAAFAHGEVLGNEIGDMICDTLYIVVFE